MLATDDMLFGTTDEAAFHQLIAEFDRYFEYTVRTGMELSFLNYRIIQSPYCISIDQWTHIRQNILQKYFLPPDKIPVVSSPFPRENSFELKLFQATNLSDEELNQLAKKHRGRYSTWTGALLHIAEKSRPDLAYAAMRLTGYNASPKAPCKHYIKLCVICGITLMFQSCTHVKTERKNLYQSTLKMERQKSYRSQMMNQMIQIWKP